jgi:hypothetical protein
MSPIPAVPPGSTGNYGANATFLINQAVPTFSNRVIKLNRLRGPTVVGYMFGGISCTVSNLPATPSGRPVLRTRCSRSR